MKWMKRMVTAMTRKLLIRALEKHWNKLRDEAVEGYLKYGPVAVDKVVDRMQETAIKVVQRVCRWKWLSFLCQFADKAEQVIQEEGDALQAKLKKIAKEKGPEGLALAFNVGKRVIEERIKAIQL